MLYFWDDPKCRMVGIDLVGDQILLQPCLIDWRAEESWHRPIVVTVPRSVDVASLGRVALNMLAMCKTINLDPLPDSRAELPDVEIDDSELPEFMEGTWEPPPPQPPTEEELARLKREEHWLRWPDTLKERLTGMSSRVDYIRNKLNCSLLQSRGQIQLAPAVVTNPHHYDSIGYFREEGCILLADDATEEELGSAIRTSLERARNPWLPFLELFRTFSRVNTSPLARHPLDPESEWIPANFFFIHGNAMNRAKFWELIRVTRTTPYSCGSHRDNLAAALSQLDPQECASFERHYLALADELYDVRVVEVMWVLSGGGPGDEGWSLFTSWLISQGKKKFEQVLRTPERIPELFPPGTDVYGDGISIAGLAQSAYETSTGRDDFSAFSTAIHGDYQIPTAPRGAQVDPRSEPEEVLEQRLRAKYPELWNYVGHFD